jgi:hypothetical protein
MEEQKIRAREVAKASPTESGFPVIAKNLVDHLDNLFPDEWPRLDMADREIWFRAGQRAVVDLLRAELDQQTREAQI